MKDREDSLVRGRCGGALSVRDTGFAGGSALFRLACDANPLARNRERVLMTGLLDTQPGDNVLDVPAGIGYLADGFVRFSDQGPQVVCVEPISSLAAAIDRRHFVLNAGLDSLPFPDSSMDRVGSLSGLIRLPERTDLFREVYRVLRPGGRFVIAEVQEDTPPANFIDQVVRRYSCFAPNGKFPRSGELSTELSDLGFVHVREQHLACPWCFPDAQAMGNFCHSLFGMVDTDVQGVLRELRACLPVFSHRLGLFLGWSQVYAVGEKPLQDFE
ncbi:MAG: methyltransferase domain-containing protein [Chromatiales bacterium]|nr:methyltransferase domain-containing protein [Chromatiales bacterium]